MVQLYRKFIILLNIRLARTRNKINFNFPTSSSNTRPKTPTNSGPYAQHTPQLVVSHDSHLFPCHTFVQIPNTF